MKKETGQIVLILLLVMSVALAIGLSVVQRSFVDVSTSTKIEQSSRAFSAAEAGIEKALLNFGTGKIGSQVFKNDASVEIEDSGFLPLVPDPDPIKRAAMALEYPPVGKEDIVHVWLSNPNDNPGDKITPYYKNSRLTLWWGGTGIGMTQNSSNSPALEVIIVSVGNDNKTYTSKKIFLDPKSNRDPVNNFIKPGGTSNEVESFNCNDNAGSAIKTIFSAKGVNNDRNFLCMARLQNLTPTLVLLRARLLYTNTTHPFAVEPYVDCPPSNIIDCSLPPQVKIIKSQGSAGSTQRTIQLFQMLKVVPFYFDYAIFSSGDINK